jgi:DNA polymerase-3 subunit delta'
MTTRHDQPRLVWNPARPSAPRLDHPVVRAPRSDYGAPVPFDAILGQPAAVGTLTHSLRSGRVHHALRFEGPDGVGKEMTALALAQALLCTGGDPLGCGTCSACRRAITMGEGTPAVPLHPDVIFVERGLYPPEAIGRRTPEAQDISVDQIRTVVLEHAAFPPHEGRARVFIIRRAEELNASAANALLKTLEEPGPGTHFILLVSRPSRLLSTIQSRTLRVRFAPLPEAVLVQILERRGVAPDVAAKAASLAAGSASAALDLVDADATRERDAFVEGVLRAIHSPDMTASLQIAESRSRDKHALRGQLEALAARFASGGREAACRNDSRALADAASYQIVLQAMRELERNASPALLIENMMMRLRAEDR